ncbi:hypothetical protein D3C73_1103580 [compost metagenome]
MIDGDVAGAAQQVGTEFLDLHQRPPPEPQEQILNQVRCRRLATDTPTHQRFHLRTLGEKHLEKMCTVAARLITLDIVGVGWESHHRSCFDLETGEATTASGARQGRNINDKYSHMQKDRVQPSISPVDSLQPMPMTMESKSHRNENGPAMQARSHGKVKSESGVSR